MSSIIIERNLPQITNLIIRQLLSDYKTHTIDGNIYYYVGKGGDGVIYRLNDEIIKIYTKIEMNIIIKEFYIFGLLRELKAINKNVVHMDKYYLALSNPVIIMELMDGDLAKWCDMMVKNTDEYIKNMTNDEFDTQWLGMIFQVTYGLMFLNRLNILHTDTKSKNILYKKSYSETVNDDYTVNSITYTIPSTYKFKISDFGAIQIVGSSSNRLTDNEIIDRIKKRDDLYELSRILYRIIVNHGINDYTWLHISKIIDQDKKHKEYHDTQKEHIDKELSHFPQKIRDRMLLRSMIYYSIENDLIHKNEIIKKHSLRMPSSKVSDVLNKLTDPNIKNIFDLFQMFKTS
jgi:serine/threonine protein kinase